MKKLIAGSWTAGAFDPDKFGKALLLFRNAPFSGGASPSQIVFNRPTRDTIPAHRRSFARRWQKAASSLEKRARRDRDLQVNHHNHTAHPLPPLAIGDRVIIQHPISKRWLTQGIVVEIGAFRDYLIKTPAGRLFRRILLRGKCIELPAFQTFVSHRLNAGHPGLNWGHFNLQSNALPLSYTPFSYNEEQKNEISVITSQNIKSFSQLLNIGHVTLHN
ncbi:hypothetical protein GHT06_009914 [Daphnia sinensis]|uniref:Uncharacterized protein n=1 Tax=Daphnia sinensis TaxID=1820382 RepID=A0AAD5LHM4_9CRUS|nr:hypothetical protein GHT06_009914 [Daphnia sinensis]